jgi:hypothetical protein
MIVEVIIIVIVNLGIRKDYWFSTFGCQFHCLQSVIIFMDGSDTQLSSGRLLWGHVS